MKKVFVILAFTSLLVSCQLEKAPQQPKENHFTFSTAPEDAIRFNDLALYPIKASNELLEANQDWTHFIPVEKAIEEKRFRITERKPFGRFTDSGAVNMLTIENKSTDTVFIMSGDVIRGGRQDRVLAENMIVLPRSIRNIEVFCVEHNRWSYPTPVDEASSNGKEEVFAFRGYYNVASKDIRATLHGSRDQQEVWNNVSAIRAQHGVETSTEAYADLEISDDFKSNKNAYLQFFEEAFKDQDNVVGVIAISGNKIISTDIFGHSSLFQKCYSALLHSYVTDAVSWKSTGEISEERLGHYTKNIEKSLIGETTDQGSIFSYDGRLVHFSAVE